MPQTVDQVRRQCLALGMDADEPLAALLIGLAEGQDETKRLIEEAGTIVRSVAGEAKAELKQARADMADKLSQPISSETMTELGRTALILVERQVGNLIQYRFRTLLLYLAVAVFVIAATSFGTGWITRGDSLEQACIKRGEIQATKDGKRFCAFWLPSPASR